MTDLDNSMQDVVSRDEEIDKLEAKLAAGQVSLPTMCHVPSMLSQSDVSAQPLGCDCVS